MDPGSYSLIAVAVFFALTTAFFAYSYFNAKPVSVGLPSVKSEWMSSLKNASGMYGGAFMVYLPMALLSFGFISDLFAQQYNMSAGSLVGIVGVLFNAGLGMFIKSRSTTTTTGGAETDIFPSVSDLPPPPPIPTISTSLDEICKIPGLDIGGYFPPSILLTSSILMFYLNGIWANNPTHSYAASGFAVLFIGLQTWFIYSKCKDAFSLLKIVGGLFIGLAIGSAGYWINSVIFPSNTPGTIGQSTKSYGSSSSTPGVGTCSAPNSQDQFVCEAYKNGELITTTIAE
jgi:hypothetical protein